MTRDPNAAAKAQQRANEEAGLQSIKVPLSTGRNTTGATASAGKKKPVFKSTLQPHNATAISRTAESEVDVDVGSDGSGAVRNGWFEERYQPRFATGCEEVGCQVCGKGFIDLGAAGSAGDEVMGNT